MFQQRGSPCSWPLLAGLSLAFGVAQPAWALDATLQWSAETLSEQRRAAELKADFVRVANQPPPEHVRVTSSVATTEALPKAGALYRLEGLDQSLAERPVLGSFVLDYDKRVPRDRTREDAALIGSLAVGRTVVLLEGLPERNEQKGTRVHGVVLGGDPLDLAEAEQRALSTQLFARLGSGGLPSLQLSDAPLGANPRFGIDVEAGPLLSFRSFEKLRLGILGGLSYVAEPANAPVTASLRVVGLGAPEAINPNGMGTFQWNVLVGAETALLVRPFAGPPQVGLDVGVTGIVLAPKVKQVRFRPTIGLGFGLFTYFGNGGGLQFRIRLGALGG